MAVSSEERQALVDRCDTYLQGRHTTLWGQFNVWEKDGRAQAANWLADEMLGVLGERSE